MEEEDKVVEEEDDSVKADTTKSNPENTTTTTGKTFQTRNTECLAEGGAIMPDQIDKTIPPSVGIMENSATTRQSVKRRKVSRLPQAGNSQKTRWISTLLGRLNNRYMNQYAIRIVKGSMGLV